MSKENSGRINLRPALPRINFGTTVVKMITRFAIFEGHIAPDLQADFRQAVIKRLLPVVKEIPRVQSVSVSFSHNRDLGAPEIAMFLITTYPDFSSLEKALKSPSRERAKDITESIFETFGRCTIHHHVAETYEQV